MRRILCAVLMAATMATPAIAAKLYLKDGGFIQAKRVWRSGGKVHVLATRDTETAFERSEVDMKRTFPKKRRVVKKVCTPTPQTTTPAAAPHEAAAVQAPVEKKSAVTLPSLPKLPEKSPESLLPSTGAGGSIRQQKNNMSEKIGE